MSTFRDKILKQKELCEKEVRKLQTLLNKKLHLYCFPWSPITNHLLLWSDEQIKLERNREDDSVVELEDCDEDKEEEDEDKEGKAKEDEDKEGKAKAKEEEEEVKEKLEKKQENFLPPSFFFFLHLFLYFIELLSSNIITKETEKEIEEYLEKEKTQRFSRESNNTLSFHFILFTFIYFSSSTSRLYYMSEEEFWGEC
jgi:hypothetical protein